MLGVGSTLVILFVLILLISMAFSLCRFFRLFGFDRDDDPRGVDDGTFSRKTESAPDADLDPED